MSWTTSRAIKCIWSSLSCAPRRTRETLLPLESPWLRGVRVSLYSSGKLRGGHVRLLGLLFAGPKAQSVWEKVCPSWGSWLRSERVSLHASREHSGVRACPNSSGSTAANTWAPLGAVAWLRRKPRWNAGALPQRLARLAPPVTSCILAFLRVHSSSLDTALVTGFCKYIRHVGSPLGLVGEPWPAKGNLGTSWAPWTLASITMTSAREPEIGNYRNRGIRTPSCTGSLGKSHRQK